MLCCAAHVWPEVRHLRFLRRDVALIQVTLVAHKQSHHSFACIPIYLLHPCLNILERLLIVDREHNYDPLCTAVVTASDGAEPLLAGSVPHLQFDNFVVHLHRPDFEVESDCCHVALLELVTRKPQ